MDKFGGISLKKLNSVEFVELVFSKSALMCIVEQFEDFWSIWYMYIYSMIDAPYQSSCARAEPEDKSLLAVSMLGTV